MIWFVLKILFLAIVSFNLAYLLRHLIFALTALCNQDSISPQIVKDVSYQPKISILIPARNEERVIWRVLARILELTYPKEKLEVIVIDDASTDLTGLIAEKFAEKNSYIRVLHRCFGKGGIGKPAALNHGFEHSSGELVFCFDADYYPQKDILEKLVACFKDPNIAAVQGRVIVLNENRNLVTKLVTLERIGGYRVDQFARDHLGLIPQFGGTVGGFRRSFLESVGGWDNAILAEDTDLTFKVYRAGYKVRYVNDAECLEEAVESWRAYWHQRSRWATGHIQCAFRHVFPILKSKHLTRREKIDGFLLLNVYFLPILLFAGWILGAFLFFFARSPLIAFLWASIIFSMYSAVGNFAPFFEVGVGVYLDGRKRLALFIPLLLVTFLLNILICTKAFFNVRKKHHVWHKTEHNGELLPTKPEIYIQQPVLSKLIKISKEENLMAAKIRSRYVDKVSTIALLLLGGLQPEDLKEWYGVTDAEIAQAKQKIERLKLQEEVKIHG